MSKKTTEPFKATCKLLDGRINSVDGIINFDGILYHAWFAKHDPDVLNGIKKNNKLHMDFGLPLTRMHDGRYAASVGFYHQYGQTVEYWNKRPDFTNGRNCRYLEAKGKIDTSAGQLKAYHFPNIIRTISDIEFYGVGTIEKIRDLLSYMPAIGKKPSAGWGYVKEWIVEPFPEDWSTEGKYGLMRPIPIEEYNPKETYQIMEIPTIPPYWKRNQTKLCYIPKVILNDDQ